jgi:hypothetical protein
MVVLVLLDHQDLVAQVAHLVQVEVLVLLVQTLPIVEDGEISVLLYQLRVLVTLHQILML